MDSFKWYNQTTEMNGQFNNNNAGDNEVDLTLKLGLSSSDIHQETPRGNTQQGSVVDEGAMNNIVGEQNLNGSQYAWPFDQMGSSSTTTVQSHFHQNSPFYPNPQQGLVSEGAMNIEGQQNFNGSQYAWPSDQMGSSSTVHNMNYGNGFNQFSAPPSVGFPPHKTTDSYDCFAPTWPLPSPPPVVPPNGGTLLDVPPRRAATIQQQRESGSFSDPSLGAQGQRFGTYNNPYKRCTNRNCNTNDTPMWRKGPQGPKTLCNACGIKYRKETEKKKKEEARRRGQHS